MPINIIDKRKKFNIILNKDIQLDENQECLKIQPYIDYLALANCDIFNLKLLLAKIRERVNLISTFVGNIKEYKNKFDNCNILLPNYNNLPNPIITQSNCSGVIKIYFNDYGFLENSVIDYVFIEISNSVNNLKAYYIIDKNYRAVYDIKSVIYAYYNPDLNSNAIGNLTINFKYVKNYTIVKEISHFISGNDLYPFPITTLFIFTNKISGIECFFNNIPIIKHKYVGYERYSISASNLNYFKNITIQLFVNNQLYINSTIQGLYQNYTALPYSKAITKSNNDKQTSLLKIFNIYFDEKEFFENCNLYA